MKRYLRDFSKTLLYSAGIGIIVGIFELVATYISWDYLPDLALDAVIGAVAGGLSRIVFVYLFKIKNKGATFSFGAVFLVIAVVSLSPFLYFYYQQDPFTFELILTIFLIAEGLGMGLCYAYYNESLKINKLLYRKQEMMKSFLQN